MWDSSAVATGGLAVAASGVRSASDVWEALVGGAAPAPSTGPRELYGDGGDGAAGVGAPAAGGAGGAAPGGSEGSQQSQFMLLVFVVIYALTVLPVLLMGVAALVLQRLQSCAKAAPAVYRLNHRIRKFFARPIPPERFWSEWCNGVSIAEFIIYAWVAGIQIVLTVLFAQLKMREWAAGEVTEVHDLTVFSHWQFNLEAAALWFGAVFLLQAPLLFVPAARGSLVNTALGLKYGEMIKWHRWIGYMTVVSITLHGVLYQALWASDSAGTWLRETFMLAYNHNVSNLGGWVSWVACVVMFATLLPAVRRANYWLFYRAHVIGAVFFVIFGIVHFVNMAQFFLAGAIVYGIDVAYRLLQTTALVDVDLDASKNGSVVSLVIPLQEGVEYKDCGHVWICIPEIAWLDYHPFSVASTSADPLWRNHLLVQSKVYGSWTKRLVEKAAECQGVARMVARIQGPFEGENMAPEEEAVYASMLFVSGGSGITAVLPLLKRAALRRKPGDESAPALVHVHTCRTVDELQMLAPVLNHTDVVDFRVHFTGPKEELQTFIAAAPAPGVFAAKAVSVSDVEAVDSDSAAYSGSVDEEELRTLPAMVGSWGLEAAVWLLCFVLAAFVLAAALPKVSPEDEGTGGGGGGEPEVFGLGDVWPMLLATLIVCPVAPLLLVAALRLLRRTWAGCVRWRRAGRSELPGDAPLLPHRHSPSLHAIEADHAGASISAMEPASLKVAIVPGRPDLEAVLRSLRGSCAIGKSVGIWSAGPKPLNFLVSHLATKLGVGKFDLHQMAFEL